MTEILTDKELDVVFYIERFSTSTGTPPTKAQIVQRFDGVDGSWLDNFERNSLVQKSFRARGINWPPAEDYLSPEQMHAIAAMTDLVDRRSDEKKLRDLGISTRQWATWLQDDRFAEYLRDRSEVMMRNSTHELHRGLMKGVRNGSVASVKLAYALTGRFREGEEEQIDMRRVLHTFIEIIQRYVKDPVTLHAISMDLSSAASAESLSTGLANQMMSNAQDYRTRTIQSSAVPSLMAPTFNAEEESDG